ncbi:MAG TPA: PHB depolymerase family esterase [Planctomycetota bacterium]|nr:PHB depolymerase family esterase [Planctomycetota bacterium]
MPLRPGAKAIVLAVFATASSWAAEAGNAGDLHPPVYADFTPAVVSETRVAGRKVVRYESECLRQWSYEEGAGKTPFVVAGPAKETANPPLLVYLHAAGGRAATYLRPASVEGIRPEFVILSPDCAQPRGPDGWWGWFWARKDPVKYAGMYSPGEHRVLATIEWVIRTHGVDRNRVYLCGHSMGGSGTLGIGMARGDLFAAIWVGVPANVDHVWFRMGFPAVKAAEGGSADDLRKVSGAGLPDAPPVVNFSSPIDGWAKAQEDFLKAAQDGRHLMIFCWAPFGHTQDYHTANPAVLEFPWLEIRRNEAYPVFTDASTDGRYPGYMVKDKPDQAGQVNGYFRWKNVTDTPAKFQIELHLVDGKGLKTPVDVPDASVVNVTPRRLQQFKVDARRTYSWRLTEGDRTVSAGSVAPDEIGLLTVPRLTITATPRLLTIEPAN